MKTILTAIAVAVFVVLPSLCFASYVIHLKSGHSFQTDRYWEEGDEIKFKRYGGVVGVRKDLVREIKEVEKVKIETPPEGKIIPWEVKAAEGEKKEKQIQVQKELPKKTENKGSERDPRIVAQAKAFMEEKIHIRNEMEMVVFAFKDAKTRNDKTEKNKQWNKLISLQKQLSDLEKRVMAVHGGRLPDWWHDGTQQP